MILIIKSLIHYLIRNMIRGLEVQLMKKDYLKKDLIYKKMVVGDGFEPSNSERADLQSAAFDRFAIPPF